MSIDYKDLKKGDKLKTTQLVEIGGTEVTSILLESPKQGRGLKSVLLIDTKGSECGFFDEAGSVYASDISQVQRDGQWFEVANHPEE
ncbi:hypothetical protein CMI37_32815 [Candidatus Pacearchaeota archaeon]|nr:hypothetical protein [Candidatus Pacearchaeota archaeon]|tara:strand:+ start:14827 stop:15087 length:261 start_codon:yes stop_codon:yes gene_type:complete